MRISSYTILFTGSEEYFLFNQFKNNYLRLIDEKFADSNVFLLAITLLTVLVFIIVFFDYFMPNQYLQSATIVVVFSGFINALQHCIGSLIVRKILAGTLTSIFFNDSIFNNLYIKIV